MSSRLRRIATRHLRAVEPEGATTLELERGEAVRKQLEEAREVALHNFEAGASSARLAVRRALVMGAAAGFSLGALAGACASFVL